MAASLAVVRVVVESRTVVGCAVHVPAVAAVPSAVFALAAVFTAGGTVVVVAPVLAAAAFEEFRDGALERGEALGDVVQGGGGAEIFGGLAREGVVVCHGKDVFRRGGGGVPSEMHAVLHAYVV
jgi:hypothetical protein